ncbi:MAG: ribosome recycling factor [Candidatus Dadabacteria bacterium]|nr:ribosome recycling factor [Candidatus Dadabacteria bacterium]NIS08818.1 ribosome recycling factor [Candidatus Dadabacteria bacterium]NIY22168.1 ribosome recycling factor [Candidatus Dadabacteria bacterium]
MAELEIENEIEDSILKMDDTIDAFRKELSRMRTGRASASLVEHIKADYYGTPTPLSQIANVSVPEPRTIVIQPWDTSAMKEIEKAIMQSDLGITPSNDGKVIRIILPVLTEDRRKELVKYVHKLAEDFRVSVRNARKDINNKIKASEKNNEITEDDVKMFMNQIQQVTDQHIAKIAELLQEKEKEILEI